uniref:Uncharacterized protein n=1 Tax=Glossina pallidipes TaxID=7398 RepID=A0A1A9Z581_GLOPL
MSLSKFVSLDCEYEQCRTVVREKETESLEVSTVHADQQCIYKLRGVGSYLYAIPRPAYYIIGARAFLGIVFFWISLTPMSSAEVTNVVQPAVTSSTDPIPRLYFRNKFVCIAWLIVSLLKYRMDITLSFLATIHPPVSKNGNDKRTGERSNMETVASISLSGKLGKTRFFDRDTLELRYAGISEGSSESNVVGQTHGQVQNMSDCKVELQSIAESKASMEDRENLSLTTTMFN